MGSNPIARSNFEVAGTKWFEEAIIVASQMVYHQVYSATWPSGKARLCKSLIHGFESHRRLSKKSGLVGSLFDS